MDFERLGDEIAQRIGEAVAEVEERARRIIEDAEREAAAIRAQAESEARVRLAEVRSALDRLEGSITSERDAVAPAPEAAAVTDDEPLIEDEEELADDDEPEELDGPEAATAVVPAESADASELHEAEVTGDGEVDEAGARLVAMEMALDGEDVEAIATRLTEEFGLVNAQEVATEVHGRATP